MKKKITSVDWRQFIALFLTAIVFTGANAQRAQILIEGKDVTVEVAERHRLEATFGFLITNVENPPGTRTQFRKNDVILSLNNYAVFDRASLFNAIRNSLRSNSTANTSNRIEALVERDGKRITIFVELGTPRIDTARIAN